MQWPQRCCHHCLVNYLSLCPCSTVWSGPDELDLEMSVVECSLPHHQQKLFRNPQMCLHPATTLCQLLKSHISNTHIMYGQYEIRRRYKVKENCKQCLKLNKIHLGGRLCRQSYYCLVLSKETTSTWVMEPTVPTLVVW